MNPSLASLPSRRLDGRLLLLFVLLGAAIATTGWFYLQRQQAAAREMAHRELEAIADLKIQQINDWRNDRLRDAQAFSESPFTARGVQTFLDSPASASARQDMFHRLTLLKGGDRYERVSLFDVQGNLRLMVPADSDPAGPIKSGHVAEALREPRVRLTDIHRGDAGDVHLNIIIPILPPAGPQPAALTPQPSSLPIAVVLLELNPNRFLYPLVQSWPTPSPTAETLLVRRDGDDALFLNELRHQKGTALTLRRPLKEPRLPAAMAARGEVGTTEGVDYRGVPVVAVVRAVPGMPWFMVAKMDRAEIYAPLREQALAAGGGLGALLLAAMLGVGLLWRQRATEILTRELAERQQAEAALRESETRFRQLFAASPDALFLVDSTGRFLDCNQTAEQRYGYSRAELLQMTARDLAAPELRDQAASQVKRAMETGGTFEWRHRRKDGTELPVEISAKPFSLGRQTCVVSSVRDITERKRAEHERQKFVMLADSSSEFIGMCDLNLQPLYVNPAGMRMVGLPDMAAACRVKVQDYFFPEDQRFIAEEFFPRVLREGHGDVEIRLRHFQTGEAIWMLYYLYNVRDASGTTVGWATVSRDITERKRAETALRQSEERLALAASGARIGLFEWNIATGKTLWTEQHGRLLGLKTTTTTTTTTTTLSQEYDYHDWAQRVHPDDLPRVEAELRRCLAEHIPYDTEYRVLWPDKSVHWLAGRGVCDYDAQGTPVRMLGIIMDITERKQAETALRTSEERMSFALHQSHTGGWELDLVDHSAHRTLEHDRIFGYDALLPQWTYEMFLEHVLPEDRPEVDRRFHKAVATQTDWSFECRIRRKDGAVRWIWAAGGHQRDAAGQARRMAGIVQDISERKEAEAALRESEERLRLALDAAHMGTFDWDVPGNRIAWSRWHEELWGFKPGEFGGTYEAFSRRVHPDDVPGINAEVARCIVAREPFSQEFRVVWPDGSVHWIMGTGEFTFDAAGQPQRMRGAVLEITARKEAEAALHALAGRLEHIREEERTRMAREVHDVLGQLLTGMTMDTAWLQRRLPKVADAALRQTMTDKLGEIGQLTDSMIKTVQEISSELRPSVLDNLGLAAAVRFEAGRFQKRSGIACEIVAMAEQLPRDAERDTALFRIFQEVLTNVARHAAATRVEIRLAEEGGNGGELVLKVGDNGRGIEPGKLSGAKSLGLLGMRERAAQFGGRVEFAGEPGKGTTVTVRVPMGRQA
jgi:PAS domain S-box-containing protein